ncbi:DUF58 domain-containing protein [Actinomadura violacea]|uniref:DUF58 domain-containing protein n=1 Tax=Actinomadura violacea TaxID=2819934 RepID=A0ABS3RPM0_9ACTN|nr:DUF58 domain-containing protein [Actinomadura violacea]MBO2458666.1 DUF58 domain-containing protein [Actinomadura violacea]
MSGHALRWRPAPHAHRLATAAVLAALAALLTGEPVLLLLAAPPLGVLAAGFAAGRPATAAIEVAVRARRCFEGEPIEITVAITAAGPVGGIDVGIAGGPAFALDDRTLERAGGTVTATLVLRPRRWGRHDLPRLTVDLRSRHRVAQAVVPIALGEVRVFPAAAPVRPRLVPLDLLRRLGDHVARTAGSGVEFAGIRPYAPGDRARDVNWKASGLRGRLHVTTRADQRQAEIVLAVDALGPRGALDRAMRGAAALAAGYLRLGDRVGIVAFGGALRWLAPGQGGQHLYRLAEAVMDAGRPDGGTAPDLARIPRSALPPGALVIVFSPLLDERAVQTVEDLRRRGGPVVVIDLLDREPPVPRRPRRGPGSGGPATGDLAMRLWRLDRRALIAGLADLGVPVAHWAPGDPLDVPIGTFARPVPGGRA